MRIVNLTQTDPTITCCMGFGWFGGVGLLEGAYGKSKILNFKLRTCNLFSSLFCLKCDPFRMRCQLIATTVYTRCCITRILWVFLCVKRCIVNYMSYELLWIIEKWNNRSLSIHGVCRFDLSKILVQ